ncbi:MAG: alpha-ribazole phosphatase family protein [Propionivibrio sp.]
MRLTLVRHTSVDVPKGVCYGKSDVSLAPTFPSELELIRSRIGGEDFDAIFSSPLGRCRRLAEAMCGGRPIMVDHRLSELDFGDWEMADWDTVYASPVGKRWFADFNTRCPNGESFADQLARTRWFLASIRAVKAGNVLVLTHAGILRAMLCLLHGLTPEQAFDTPLAYGHVLSFDLETR